jgi:RNA chaperone Hfq
MVNRKLVRPNLAEIKERLSTPRPVPSTPAAAQATLAPAPAREGHGPGPHSSQQAARRRPVPPEQTSAEAFYYLKQMNNRTPMVIVLDGGEQLRGHIEWYDRSCIKVNRDDAPNLLVFKHAIRYLFKQEEENNGKTSAEAGAE